jgi:DNA polymerase-3 subunit alpha
MLDRREQLEWEKELIGLYVSDHPITPYLPFIRQKASHFSNDLAEAAHQNQSYRGRAGSTRITHPADQKGDPMAFVSIEDLQGPVDLVIFPRTWNEFGALLQVDAMILVEGKVDSERGDAKVLVDSVRTITPEDVTDEMPRPRRLPCKPSPNPRAPRRRERLPPAEALADEPSLVPEAPPEPEDWHLTPASGGGDPLPA